MPEKQSLPSTFNDIQPTAFPESIRLGDRVFAHSLFLGFRLTSISGFDSERGFYALDPADSFLVENIVSTSRFTYSRSIGIEPGRLGIIRVDNPIASVDSHFPVYILPLAFDRIENMGILAGVFISFDKETGEFSISTNVIEIGSHVITGIA